MSKDLGPQGYASSLRRAVRTRPRASCWRVQPSDLVWGDIFVSTGRFGSGLNRDESVTIACHTVFGSFTHHWVAIEGGDWRSVCDPEKRDLTMTRFMGERWLVPDFEETLRRLREVVGEAHSVRAPGSTLPSHGSSQSPIARLALAEREARTWMPDERRAVQSLADAWLVDDFEEVAAWKRDPRGNAFWEEIWLPFCDKMRLDLMTDRQMRDLSVEADVQDSVVIYI